MVKTTNANVGREGHGEVGGNSRGETPNEGMRFHTKNKKCFDPNLYSKERFEDLFTKGIMLKRSEDRTVDKFDAYRRILHHIISNIVIPNVGHKSSSTNMHSFVMLAMMGFSKNEEEKLIMGGQEEDSENSDEEEEEEGNEHEQSDYETRAERIRRETRKKKRQERTEEGSSSSSMNQVMEIIAFLQISICTRLDALDSKISDIQERFIRFEATGRDEG
ncbi:hypothetical protein M9H77_16644 [Catharanthus roseus]|uniref:Uncharacterized protein n=1 Tax=Catharanthus roseus TaxID=4058 RepID=A0ACC0B2C8_CATRO|nr:hypothetical protein M9H77_16644 [Catharanthus roseus]